MSYQTITRKGHFDACHRVVNQISCCRFIHGHSYLYELTFKFDQIHAIGYALDFKEIKRIGCQWIEDFLDHGTILNPEDNHLLRACESTESRMWQMSLNGAGKYCNPTAENIAKEMFLAISLLLNDNILNLYQIRLYETPNCFTDCFAESITEEEKTNFMDFNKNRLQKYKEEKGIINYDDREKI